MKNKSFIDQNKKYLGKFCICLADLITRDGTRSFGRTGTITGIDITGYLEFLPDGNKWDDCYKIYYLDDLHFPEIDGMNPVALNPKYDKKHE